jgi:hypothetical protein
MSLHRIRLLLPAIVFAGLTISCANRATAPTDAPHATITMRDGTQFAGTVTASSPSGITLLGDDRISHTFSMSQVRSVDYDQAQPPLVDPGATSAAAGSSGATTSGAPNYSSNSSARTRSDAIRSERIHESHYHPSRTAIRTTTYTLPAGALIPVRSEETIDAAIASEGQTYAAEVTEDVTDDSGAVVIPRGSNAQIIIRSAVRGGRIKGASDLVLDLDSVSVDGRRYRLDTTDVVRKGRDGVGKNRRTAEFTGGGAVIGSIIGAIAGGGRGAAIGAAAGAGAGAGTQIVTRGKSIRIPAETILTFKLETPLRVAAAN